MGWTTTRYDKLHNETFDEWYKKEFPLSDKFEYAGKGYLVNMSEYYVPVRHKETNRYFCEVSLVRFSGKGWNKEVSIKTMDETMGPGVSNCPKAVLDIIEQSEPSCEWAAEWRKSCRDKLTKIQKSKSVKVGQILRFKNKIRFSNGEKIDTFMLCQMQNGRKYFKSVNQYYDGTYYTSGGYRITGWTKMDYEILDIKIG